MSLNDCKSSSEFEKELSWRVGLVGIDGRTTLFKSETISLPFHQQTLHLLPRSQISIQTKIATSFPPRSILETRRNLETPSNCLRKQFLPRTNTCFSQLTTGTLTDQLSQIPRTNGKRIIVILLFLSFQSSGRFWSLLSLLLWLLLRMRMRFWRTT